MSFFVNMPANILPCGCLFAPGGPTQVECKFYGKIGYACIHVARIYARCKYAYIYCMYVCLCVIYCESLSYVCIYIYIGLGFRVCVDTNRILSGWNGRMNNQNVCTAQADGDVQLLLPHISKIFVMSLKPCLCDASPSAGALHTVDPRVQE